MPFHSDSLKNTNSQVIEIFENFNYRYNVDFFMDDIRIIKYVISVISMRAAKLLACCLSVLVQRLLNSASGSSPAAENDEIGIAFDGSLYKHHPRLRNWIDHYTERLLDPLTHDVPNGCHGKEAKKKFFLMLAEDGSGKGAAMVAAIANRLKDAAHS